MSLYYCIIFSAVCVVADLFNQHDHHRIGLTAIHIVTLRVPYFVSAVVRVHSQAKATARTDENVIAELLG